MANSKKTEKSGLREHNQEGDHLANLGAEWKREITVEKGNNTENWKAVRGFSDGSNKTDGRSGCGVVINVVDRDKWVTISKIALPLKACITMTAEVVGASVLTVLLDLVLGEALSVNTIQPVYRRHHKVHLRI